MPRSIPDAPTLLTAVVKYLDEELLPTLSGYHHFKARVTINVLNMIKRELELCSTQSAAERARLGAILGHEGEVAALSDELSDLIRRAAIDLNDEKLRTHIRQSLAEALAINNPKWVVR
jgi:Domain of unknown function (DUF6285)